MLQVSFYSYKGGAGRSTTSWNTIQRLVELVNPTVEEPFVIVDTDTESAGSTFLYEAEDIFRNNDESQSIQKRIKDGLDRDYMDADEDEKREFFNGMHPVGIKYFGCKEDKAVLFIGADLDESSKKDMPTIDKNTANGKRIIDNFRNITKTCRLCGAKALFFDTPSGTQDLARLSIGESKIIVCCMRPTNQFREGTKRQLISFISDKNMITGKRKYILTPTAICVDPYQEFHFGGIKLCYPQEAKENIKIAFSTEKMEDSIKQSFEDNVILDMLDPTPADIKIYPNSEDNDIVFGIPEIKRFKWFEACLGKLSKDENEPLSPNDQMAVRRYEYLAQTILKYSNVKKD